MHKSKLKCLFGFHDFTISCDSDDPHILLCKHCRRFGCSTWSGAVYEWEDKKWWPTDQQYARILREYEVREE